MYQQLSFWLLYGDLNDYHEEFFIRKTDEDKGVFKDKTKIKVHLEACIGSTVDMENFKILKRIHKDVFHRAFYEALFIR